MCFTVFNLLCSQCDFGALWVSHSLQKPEVQSAEEGLCRCQQTLWRPSVPPCCQLVVLYRVCPSGHCLEKTRGKPNHNFLIMQGKLDQIVIFLFLNSELFWLHFPGVHVYLSICYVALHCKKRELCYSDICLDKVYSSQDSLTNKGGIRMLLIFLMRYTVQFYSKIVSVLPWHAHILWFHVWFNVILTVYPNNTHLFYMILCLIQCNFTVECQTKILFYLS